MRKLLWILVLFIAQQSFGQTGATLFGGSAINNGDMCFNASFTPDGQTVFFTKASVNWAYIAIFYTTLKNGEWSEPKAMRVTGQYRDCDPFVSADGKNPYFSSE